tara:strand:+ start:4372 stop:5466 length:1095 start_codon:yes stop_codon:yes gene_type:complete
MKKNKTIIKSPKLEPYIFNNMFSDYILKNKKLEIKLNFNELGSIFYNSIEAQYYNNLSNSLILNNTNPEENLILYMNFKSHNILDNTKREKLYSIIDKYNPNIICLSEALLPISIHNNKLKDKKIKLVNINNIEDDTIISAYKGAPKFVEKKKNSGAKLKEKNIWKSFFIEKGYKYILFSNPTECPWGTNWGNCIITKFKPDMFDVLQLGSYGKTAFDVPESRSMVIIKINNEYICTTHLDNNNEKSRIGQTKEIIKYIKNLKLKKNEYITLVGDLNAINKNTYSKEELNILKEININKEDVPVDAVNLLDKSKLLGPKPINTGQKYESLYQKCVTHVYSTKYKNNVMILTDATDLDHQPIFIW